MNAKEIQLMKERLETRLLSLGIKKYKVTDLRYLDYSNVTLQLPYDAGRRMFIGQHVRKKS
jgi:hypothetical protein